MKRSMKITAPVFFGSYFELLKRSLASIAMLGVLTTQTYAAEKKETTVTISPVVLEQIQKASPDDRKKMEVVINTGNKFIPYHFDGSAYANGDNGNDQELKYWLKHIRPMVNRDVKEWYNDTYISSASALDLEIKGQHAFLVAVCPQIELISIAAADEHFDVGWKTWYPMDFKDDSFVLKYQVKIIGTWDVFMGVPPKKFLSDDKDEFETVLVSLDKSNKISQVASQYAVTAWSTKSNIELLTLYISGVWASSTTADTRARLKQLIQKLTAEEAKVCNGTQVTPKLSIKE